jgi:hypothetical protein
MVAVQTVGCVGLVHCERNSVERFITARAHKALRVECIAQCTQDLLCNRSFAFVAFLQRIHVVNL